MSYILDALRRLEQDKEKTRMSTDPIRVVLKGGGTSERTSPGIRGTRVLWPWYPAGILVLFLLVGVTFWFARSTAPVKQEAGSGSLSAPPPALTAGGPSMDAALAARRVPETSRLNGGEEGMPAATVPPGTAPSPAARAPGRAPVAALPVLPPPSAGVLPAAGKPSAPGSPPEDAWGSAQPDTARAAVPVVAAVPPPAPLPAPADRFTDASAPRLSAGETGLRISAIVWSPNRQKRFAIVNLKTVHEGDLVDDGRVVQIREDEVIFEKAGRRFSVGMGKR